MFNIPSVTFLQEKNNLSEEQKGQIKKHFLMVNILGKMQAFLETGNMIGPIIGGILFKQGGSLPVFLPICFIQLLILSSFAYCSKYLDQKLQATIQSSTTLPEIVSQRHNLEEFIANNIIQNSNSIKLTTNNKVKQSDNEDLSCKDLPNGSSSIKNNNCLAQKKLKIIKRKLV